MKKIIALLLILCCLFAVTACGKEEENSGGENSASANDLQRFMDMLSASAPKKSVAEVTVSANGLNLVSTYTLKTGTVGGKTASTFESKVTTLADVENDQGDLKETEMTVTNYYYLEDKGVKSTWSSWDPAGVDFAPQAGDLYIDLRNEYFSKTEYYSDASSETLVLEVDEDLKGTNGYLKKILAYFIPADQAFGYEAKITITASGGRISNILIECIDYERYIGDEFDPVPITDTIMTIDVDYSYNIQLDINID